MGVLVVLLFAYLFWVGSLTYDRSQELLFGEYRKTVVADSAANTAIGGEGASGVLTGEESTVAGGERTQKREVTAAPMPPGRGEPVALLEIPALDVEEVVVQGTGSAELRGAPGHFRNTAMPGEAGNAAIAGRRTTFGAPFSGLDRLERGDRIVVTTSEGTSRFRVTGSRTIGSGDPDPTRPTREARLTLVTSAPEYLATERLVVVADLVGLPVEPRFDIPTAVVDETESGLGSGGQGALAPMLLWGALLVGAYLGARWSYRRWLRWPTYLISTPVLLALCWLFFESLSQLLPATL